MNRILMGLALSFALAAIASAALVGGNMTGSIINETNWTASSSSLNQWIAPDYSDSNGYAQLTHSHTGNSWNVLNSSRRSMLYAIDMPETGSYDWSFDNRLNDYNKQYCYWQAYLVKEGATIDLVAGPAWSRSGNNYRIINSTKGYAPNHNDDGQWHSYSQNFNISCSDTQNYDYVAFVLVGTKHHDEMMDYRSMSTSAITSVSTPVSTQSVPEPVMLALFAVGAVHCLRQRRNPA